MEKIQNKFKKIIATVLVAIMMVTVVTPVFATAGEIASSMQVGDATAVVANSKDLGIIGIVARIVATVIKGIVSIIGNVIGGGNSGEEDIKVGGNYKIKFYSGLKIREANVTYGPGTYKIPDFELKNPGYNFIGWKAYRDSDDSWYGYNTEGKVRWSKTVDESKGYNGYFIYKTGQKTGQQAKKEGEIVKMYAVWEKESTGVTLDVTTASLEVGGTKQLAATVAPTNATNKAVTWNSSDSSVATVSNSGLVTAVKAGKATITATSNNKKTATCTVTVSAKTSFTCKIERTKVDPKTYNNNEKYEHSYRTGRNYVKYCELMDDYLIFVEGASKTYKVDPVLIMAIILRETNAVYDLLGPKLDDGYKCAGLMQIHPEYAEDYVDDMFLIKGGQYKRGEETAREYNLFDPKTNIYTGTNEMKKWLKENDNNEDKALARYSGNGNNTSCKYVKAIKEFKEIIKELYTF